MTSSLPNFLASPAVPAGNASTETAADLSLLGAAPATTTAPEFSSLVGDCAPAAATTAATTPGSTTVPAGTNAATASVATPTPAATASVSVPTTIAFVLNAAAETATESTDAVNSTDDVAPADAASAGKPAKVSKESLEEAVSFVMSLLQNLLPEATGAAGTQATEVALAHGRCGHGGGHGRHAALDGDKPEGRSEVSSANLTADAESAPLATTEPEAAQPVFTVAADGAIEATLELTPAPAETDEPVVEAAVTPDESATTPTPVEVAATLELPGQAVVRLLAKGAVNLDATSTGEFVRGAIFAGLSPRSAKADVAQNEAAERNFVSPHRKEVSTTASDAGIAVAQDGASMPLAPTEEINPRRSTAPFAVSPARDAFQVAQPSTERITVSATEPAGHPFAERAVATITGLVEAQFSASMQRSGSVQLKMKFGGEDLSVRVEMRGGVVHTDFQTDSADLRAAISREWQAVASESPERMSRYLEPVFSPVSGTSNQNSANSDGQQQSSFARQQSAQQDQSQRSPRFFGEEPAPFARRSLLSESFFPEPVEPRVPALLPTSLRLSALA